MQEITFTMSLADVIVSAAALVFIVFAIRRIIQLRIERAVFDQYVSLTKLLDTMRAHAHKNKDLSGYRYIKDVSQWNHNHFMKSSGLHKRAPWMLRKLRRIVLNRSRQWESLHPHAD